MRTDVAVADRAQSIRSSLESLARAGLVPAEALAAGERRHPDDRVRRSLVVAELLGMLTVVAVAGALGLWMELLDRLDEDSLQQASLLLAGILLGVLTEWLLGAARFAGCGVETVSAWFAAVLVSSTVSWSVVHGPGVGHQRLLAGLVTGAVFTFGAWRWGRAGFGFVAATSVLVGLTGLALPRLVLAFAGAVAAPVLGAAGRARRLPPAHRLACTEALWPCLAALYAALHVVNWDATALARLAENLDLSPWDTPAVPRLVGVVATAVLPVLLVACGIRFRHRVILVMGLLTGAASLVTLGFYVHVAPAWLLLMLSGAALLGGVFALRRWLDAGPDGERHGFTAGPPAPSRPAGFEAGGGRSGGAGASGEY